MTHEEMRELLAGYAVDALDEDEAAVLDEHLASCLACRTELRSLQETVDVLADAVPQLPAPERLRTRLVPDARRSASQPSQTAPRSSIQWRGPGWSPRVRRLSLRVASLAAALTLVVLSATAIGMLNTIGQQRQELARDRAALGLLTSTETQNERLGREASWLPADAHGHWFHRDGVPTQVVVGELLPEPLAGQHYVVWMLRPAGWTPAGTMTVDASGYGRLVILGSDGADASAVLITREAQTAGTPGPDVVLRYQRAF